MSGKSKKVYTGRAYSDVEQDEETKKFFFLLTYKNGNVRKFEDGNKARLTQKREEMIKKEELKDDKEFRDKMPKEDIEKLKDSGPERKTDTQVVVRSGNTEMLQLRKRVIMEAKMKGFSDIQIKKMISEEFEISEVHVSREINLCEAEIRNYAIVTHEEILLSHVERYEQLYHKFKSDGAEHHALRALRLKEGVVGLHDQVVNIQINNFFAAEYDTNQMPVEKRARLKQLLSKVKVR